MINEPQPPKHEVGRCTIEVFGSGSNGNTCKTRFHLRCDGVGLHDNDILLLSAVGSETSVKALTAGLRSSARDQTRIDYGVHLGSLHESHLTKCPHG